MILQAKIAKADEPQEGVSATTGKKWVLRRVLIAFDDEAGEEYISVGVDEDVWQKLGLQEGMETTIRLKFFTRQNTSGYVTNHVRIVEPHNL